MEEESTIEITVETPQPTPAIESQTEKVASGEEAQASSIKCDEYVVSKAYMK